MRPDKAYAEYLEAYGLTEGAFSQTEQLIVTLSREMSDNSVAMVGTGLPMVAASLAQRLHAQNMTIILETGSVGPMMASAPSSVADPRGAYKAAALGTLIDAFGSGASRGYCAFGVLGGAQCDMYGNLNSTCIGDYCCAGTADGKESRMRRRLTGCGGATDIAAMSDKVILTMEHELRRFPAHVDFITSVAGMGGPPGKTRFDCGLYRGGDIAVITDMCIMRGDAQTGILYASEIYDGISCDEIKANTGWDIDVSRAAPVASPTYEELRLLRMEVDPKRIYLNRKRKA